MYPEIPIDSNILFAALYYFELLGQSILVKMAAQLCLVSLLSLLCIWLCVSPSEAASYEGEVVKGNRNALFLVRGGHRLMFPDFYTFTQMGFNMSVIRKIPDPELNAIPVGAPIKPIPVYRPEDFMYHRVCTDAERLVSRQMPRQHLSYFT